ncbi:MAG: hypothetical protein PUH36_02575 [Subdoligranulum sp.]|nr:hypothetical protein [Subdoligranulum sp.]
MDKNFTFLKIIHNFLRKKWYNSTKFATGSKANRPAFPAAKQYSRPLLPVSTGFALKTTCGV